jgi:hypothetical protein
MTIQEFYAGTPQRNLNQIAGGYLSKRLSYVTACVYTVQFRYCIYVYLLSLWFGTLKRNLNQIAGGYLSKRLSYITACIYCTVPVLYLCLSIISMVWNPAKESQSNSWWIFIKTPFVRHSLQMVFFSRVFFDTC